MLDGKSFQLVDMLLQISCETSEALAILNFEKSQINPILSILFWPALEGEKHFASI